jgi:SRSO17 transposase
VLLARRSLGDRDDMQAHMCYAPAGAPVEKLVEVAGSRWTVETCFREANV